MRPTLYCRRCQARRTADTLTQRIRDEVCLYVCALCGTEEGVWLHEEEARDANTPRDARPLPLRERYGRGARGVCAACGQTRVVYPRHGHAARWCGTCLGRETRRQGEARDA